MYVADFVSSGRNDCLCWYMTFVCSPLLLVVLLNTSNYGICMQFGLIIVHVYGVKLNALHSKECQFSSAIGGLRGWLTIVF